MSERPCLHCAIWAAIRAHAPEHDASALIVALAEVAADIVALVPDEDLLRAQLHFGATLTSFVSAKRQARASAAAAADPERAGATLQ